jgi:anti-sigma factor RsiW
MSVFSCNDTGRLASAALDGDLTVAQALALHTHLLMCPTCARFHRNLEFLRAAARRLTDPAADGGAEQARLSAAARDRLQRAIDQRLDERSRHAGLEP